MLVSIRGNRYHPGHSKKKKITLNGEPPGPDLTLRCSIIWIHIWEPDTGRNMILYVAPGRAEPVNAYKKGKSDNVSRNPFKNNPDKK